MPAVRRLARGGLILLIGALAIAAACSDDGEPDEGSVTPGTSTPAAGSGPELVSSDVARNEANPAAAGAIEAATNAFAADLYAALAAREAGNLVFSPYSAAIALAMTREGAAGQTASELDAVLHAGLAGDLGAGFNALDQALASIAGEYEVGDETVTLELATANQLFGQQGFEFQQPFLDALAADYGAGMRLVDYAADPDGSRRLINEWVAGQTRDRIEELIPAGVIDQLTRLVLTNAIYLNAPWERTFEEAATADGAFTTLAGNEVTAPFMRQRASFPYAAGDGFQAVELPYVGGRLSMLLVLPDEGVFETLEASLTAESIAAFRAALTPIEVDLALPRFEFRTQAPLKSILSELGMPTAFTEAADFSGISLEADLLIQDVLHEAFISVDEDGTEAAAATAVVVGLTSAPLESVELRLDRPFLFLIQERETGAVLFLGRVTDPTTD